MTSMLQVERQTSGAEVNEANKVYVASDWAHHHRPARMEFVVEGNIPSVLTSR
jgi:hypothetical protein